jgi:uncharacterized protein YggE
MKISNGSMTTILASVLLLFWTEAIAQVPDSRKTPPSVTVTGEATVAAEPDVAEIDIGVTTQSKTAVEAANDNAQQLSKITAEVKRLLGAGDELKTTGYSLTPNYRYPREGGKSEIVGYTATNVLRVKTGTLSAVGKFIDAAARSGANRIQRLSFALKDEQIAQRQALRNATMKAKSKAEEIARALGLKIVKVLSVTENERSVRPIIHEAMVARAEPSTPQTPIEAGNIEIRSTVTLIAELSGR